MTNITTSSRLPVKGLVLYIGWVKFTGLEGRA
jgi:hypothetical protein